MAEATGDTAYLVVCSGFDAVCMHRREGSFPIRALVPEAGSRRPLGVGAGGLAMLAAVESEERQHIIERVALALPDFGRLDAVTLAQACDQARADGVAVISNRVGLGVTAVGMTVRDTLGQPIAAMSVMALSQRMGPQRIRQIADLVGSPSDRWKSDFDKDADQGFALSDRQPRNAII
ncbi:IclR family transcriptional regulator [Variovorax sp. LT1R16]|uniref:IclR family transcriptional regulator n=1 Tax=Variovorax sp. LT1R16 TaxID=3443728 RepID=UPI003F45DF2B